MDIFVNVWKCIDFLTDKLVDLLLSLIHQFIPIMETIICQNTSLFPLKLRLEDGKHTELMVNIL